MAHSCLTDFLERLEQAGELARVGAEVDPVFEVAEVTGRTMRNGGPALVFGAVRGHEIPVVTNLLGTESRICLALGVRSLDEVAERIGGLVEPAESPGWLGRVASAALGPRLDDFAAKTVKTGRCQQIVRLGDDVDLAQLPVLRYASDEPGPTITGAEVFAIRADTGRLAVGRHDVRVLDRNRLAVCWHGHDEAAGVLEGYRERNAPMPLAVVLGGDPAGLLAAVAPVGDGADRGALAGFLRGKAREFVPCRTVDLRVPTDAEIVIEGQVDPAEPLVGPGPVASSGGFCRPGGLAPRMHVTAVTHRRNPVYPALVPGRPPDEACVVGRALGRAFVALVRQAIPELVDYHLPAFGSARHGLFASIRKRYAGQGAKVAHALWGMRPWMLSKLLVIVDEDVDVYDPHQVWAAVASHVAFDRDVLMSHGPADPLDPAAVSDAPCAKLALDATAKLPEERSGTAARPIAIPEETRRLVTARWSEYGLR
jgi:4-hydroxy-3-polyprenylbenzoate decarboxylase